jgi:predicted secreted protein
MKKIILLISILYLVLGGLASAEEELNFNMIRLGADASRLVDNDIMVAIMTGSAQANSAQEAASKVNSMLTWALDIGGKIDDVTIQSMNYQTRPMYKNQTVIGWSANQQIRLESQDFATLSRLIGTLQEKLRVTSMHFNVSTSRKKEVTKDLIGEALQNFEEKARLVVSSLGARDYRIVSISIRDERGRQPDQRPHMAEAQVSAMRSNAPAVEAGESRVTVWIDGKIQLIF